MCNNTTTQTTEIPEKSEDEKALDAMVVDVFMPAYMDTMGYTTTQSTSTTYENPGLVSSLEDRKKSIQEQIDTLGYVEGPTAPGKETAAAASQKQKLQQLQAELAGVNKNLEKQYKTATTKIDYNYELNDTGKKLQEIRDKSLSYQSESMDMTMDNIRKFMKGDFSITPAQKAEIEDSMKSVRDPVFKLLDEVQGQYEQTGKDMTAALSEYMTEISNTGLSVGAALNAIDDSIKNTEEGIYAGISEEEKRMFASGLAVRGALMGVRAEIDRTGSEAMTALEDAYKLRTVLAKREMEDYYDQSRRSVATKAASLGRSPMDPTFVSELNNNMARKVETMQLEMAEKEAFDKSGLLERTGMRREQLGMEAAAFTERQGEDFVGAAERRTETAGSAGLRQEAVAGERAALASSQGGKLEGAQAQKIGIAERTGAGREGVAGQKAGLEESVQTTGQNLRWQQGMGIPAQQAGLGVDVAGFNQAVYQQQLGNAAGGINAGATQQSLMQNERMAQPTTTVTQQGSTFGTILGTLGALGGGAGSIMAGYGQMQ